MARMFEHGQEIDYVLVCGNRVVTVYKAKKKEEKPPPEEEDEG